MGRLFIAAIDSASATTQRDIVEVDASTWLPVTIHEVYVTTDLEQDANEAQDELQIGRRYGAVTTGSGGTTATGYALDGKGASQDSAVVKSGSTTQATGGTLEVLGYTWMNNRLGWHYLPTPESRIIVGGDIHFVVAMQAAFAAATAFGGYVIYEELVS